MSTFYLPVATPEMVEMAGKLSAGRQAKGKAAFTVIQCTDSGYAKWRRRRRGNRLLAGVTNPEKLYVLIHGLRNAQYQPVGLVGARRGAEEDYERGLKKWRGGTMRSYTPAGLADHLAAEGLSKQFVDLRLFACYGGVASNNLPGNVSFAQALKAALVARGYASIMVTGYLGALSDGYMHVDPDPEGVNAGKHGITPSPHATHLSAEAYKTVSINGESVIASLGKQAW